MYHEYRFSQKIKYKHGSFFGFFSKTVPKVQFFNNNNLSATFDSKHKYVDKSTFNQKLQKV